MVAPISGTLSEIIDTDERGRFVKKGEPIATIAAGPWVVRCLASAEQVADIQPWVGQPVRVRLVANDVREYRGTIREVGVKGSRSVFSPALTQLGGGQIAVEPHALRSDTALFELVIDVRNVDPRTLRYGSRAAVRFDTNAEPYGAYLQRRVRQFMNKLRMR